MRPGTVAGIDIDMSGGTDAQKIAAPDASPLPGNPLPDPGIVAAGDDQTRKSQTLFEQGCRFAEAFRIGRCNEQTIREVPRGVIEAAHAMGASEWQIVWRVLVLEARAGLVLALTVLAVSFLSYSAIAGVVGGGGIGDLAIRYGYYRFETDIMLLTVALLVVIVQIIQFGGNAIAHRLDKR